MRSISEHASRCSAFTLIELLVSIGVIALLLGLLIPALARARGSARQTVCLSNLHGIAVILDTYQQTYNDSYPFVRFNQPIAIEPPDEGGGELAWDDPWKLILYWPATMHDIAPWRHYFGAWVCPGSDRDPDRPWLFAGGAAGMSSYSYARSFQGAPVLWTPDAFEDPGLIRAVRRAEVQFPSSKVVMFDTELAHLTSRGRDRVRAANPMLFVDGHTRAFYREDATPPTNNNPFVDYPESLHDTPAGVRGRDY